MYFRFVSQVTDSDLRRRQGIVQAAIRLRDAVETPFDLHVEIGYLIHWLNENMDKPDRFSRSRRSNANAEAISWVKESALEHLKHLREMAQLLRTQGVEVEELSTSRPGYVVYEDEHQVVAVPFRETPT